ncbi:MAG: class I SAM-dependent methyltransferase [Clostridia bacterium]|nr:class I SAM-dependent methyltransferase [Clostridia bacterium]
MAEHYFSQSPESAHEYRTFTVELPGRTLTFDADAGVFSKEHIDPGSDLLCKSLPEDLSGRVLDMGAGWGAMSVMILAEHPDVEMTMAEINERALALAERNIRQNGMTAKAVLSDGFAAVDGLFDAIVTNPPIRAGKNVIYGMFRDAADHLVPGGSLYLVIRKQQGADSAGKYLAGLYERVEVLRKKSGYVIYQCIKGAEQ